MAIPLEFHPTFAAQYEALSKLAEENTMSHPERASIPAIDEDFSDEDFTTATKRVRDAREQALQDPHFAAAVESKRNAIDRRVSTLAALRKARGLTQAQLSDDLDMSQGEISRLERRENLHLATLARFIEATGGQLRITAVYDDDEVDIGFGFGKRAAEAQAD